MSSSNKGFSLIELLVVLGIMAVLTGLIAFNFNAARSRSRDLQRKNDLKELRTALELYKNDNQQYPSSADYSALIGTLSAAGYIKSTLQDPKLTLTGDPESWEEYAYATESPYATYSLSVCLENRSDSQATGADCGPDGVGKYYVFSTLESQIDK